MSGPLVCEDGFLVVTRKAADLFRDMAGEPLLPESEIRAILIPVINRGLIILTSREDRGLVRVILADMPYYLCRCKIVLVWGVNEDKTPKLSPDGTKPIVFVASFEGIPVASDFWERVAQEEAA